MRIAEIYKSVQGEGLLTGTASVFVRASGCNLRCWFCDTPHASWHPEGRDYAVDEIVAEIEEWDCRHVVLTGGEPMLFAELIPLAKQLRSRGRHITIETAGTLYLPVACDLMSISPKLTGSGPDPASHSRWSHRHERQRFQPDVLRRLLEEYACQIKFVVDQPSDVQEIQEFVATLGDVKRHPLLLMPQGRTWQEIEAREAWVSRACAANGWRYCPRKQLEWFGTARRT
jgi:7-carboxy-7-deazaguanine synthase